MSILAQNLKKYREKAGMTQEELANKLEVERTLLSKYEKGHLDPTTARLSELADIFGTTTDALLGRSSYINGEV